MDAAHPSDLVARIASLLDTACDVLSCVLDEGELDELSRARLAGLYRAFNQGAADLTPEPTSTAVSRDHYDHVGSLSMIYFRMPSRVSHAIEDTGLVWLDELDRVQDDDLRAHRGIGPQTIACLRHQLDAYYWRGAPDESDALWRHISWNLQQSLDNPHVTRVKKQRVTQGLEFAGRVLRERGRPLADPSAPRLAVPS